MSEAGVLIRFDLSLYRREAVEEAVAAFAPFATLTLRAAADAVEVDVSDIAEAHTEVLEHELCNFALFQTAVLARGVGG